jgi:hypothetical protein
MQGDARQQGSRCTDHLSSHLHQRPLRKQKPSPKDWAQTALTSYPQSLDMRQALSFSERHAQETLPMQHDSTRRTICRPSTAWYQRKRRPSAVNSELASFNRGSSSDGNASKIARPGSPAVGQGFTLGLSQNQIFPITVASRGPYTKSSSYWVV